jgi:hypothetical protein
MYPIMARITADLIRARGDCRELPRLRDRSSFQQQHEALRVLTSSCGYYRAGGATTDLPKKLTTCSSWDKVEHMYGKGEVLPPVHARAGGRARGNARRPVQVHPGWEIPAEGHPNEAGQARVQVSTHARWWGSRWSSRGHVPARVLSRT